MLFRINHTNMQYFEGVKHLLCSGLKRKKSPTLSKKQKNDKTKSIDNALCIIKKLTQDERFVFGLSSQFLFFEGGWFVDRYSFLQQTCKNCNLGVKKFSFSYFLGLKTARGTLPERRIHYFIVFQILFLSLTKIE